MATWWPLYPPPTFIRSITRKPKLLRRATNEYPGFHVEQPIRRFAPDTGSFADGRSLDRDRRRNWSPSGNSDDTKTRPQPADPHIHQCRANYSEPGPLRISDTC